MKYRLAVLLMAPVLSTATAQENEWHAGELFEQQLENQAAEEESETEDDALWQYLDYRRRHRLDLNAADGDALQQLNLLTDLQVFNIIRYRQLLGKLLSIYELQAIPGLDLASIRRLLPFVTVEEGVQDVAQLRKRFAGGEKQLLLRLSQVLEKAKGFNRTDSGSYYTGSPLRIFFRYKYRYQDLLQYGITGDKDAGEEFFKGKQQQGFDFHSAHFFLRKCGIIKALALGDYSINLGQGLIHWQGQGFKKGSAVLNIKRQGAVVKPYSAAGEFNFQRGAAITLQRKQLQATAFVSWRRWSASVKNDNAGDYVTSVLSSGYHRTAGEWNNRNRLRCFAAGGNIQYNNDRLHMGINLVRHAFSIPFRASDDLYDLFAMTGNYWLNYSVDYSYTLANCHFFGELAADQSLHTAFLQGVLVSADPAVDIAMVYRSISPAWQVISGNAFTENSRPVNERGLYAGISIRPAYRFRLDAYADFFRFPWLRYQADAPSGGYDYLLQLTWTPNRNTEILTRYRLEEKGANITQTTGAMRQMVQVKRRNWRTQVNWQVSPALRLRKRVELVWHRAGDEGGQKAGFLGFADLRYAKPWSAWNASCRVQFFEAEDYDVRIYAVENSVLYSSSAPAFFNEGIRWYLNFSYKIRPLVSKRKAERSSCLIGLNISSSAYAKGTTIGSGQDVLPGSARTEVKLQLLISLG